MPSLENDSLQQSQNVFVFYVYRIHTFAWGPEICSELMAGLANESGGQYKVIREEDRLQTKVQRGWLVTTYFVFWM